MLGWLRSRRRAKVHALMPSVETFSALLAQYPALRGFGTSERERLRELAAEILATKSFHGAGGLDPGYEECLHVATLAAAPILRRGVGWYRGFGSFILQPRAFVTEVEEVDEAGVVHRHRDLRAGEAWERGPIVLALEDVRESGQHEGYNVVVHEVAHQLDHEGGPDEGFPELPRGIEAGAWTREFSAAYERLHRQLDRGEEPFIDPYAAESPAEFFAVACEYFFDAPEALREEQPGIYGLLRDYFQQDPAARLAPQGG